MRLNRMEIIGFKSFGLKASLKFSTHGVTSIIGPNGCGKSNIVDALRWALGEQSAKALRGKEMQDVVFAGSQSQEKAKFCEVSLFFHHEPALQPESYKDLKYKDFQEIMITRRLNADGENEYLINKTPCRLSEIRDLLLDSGLSGSKSYSIIEQGSIGAFLLARPVERRMMIDEAAGILKYKNKKRDSTKRLEDTTQNLLRLQDLLAEKTKNFENLKTQAEQAQSYFEAQGKMDR